MMLTIKNFLYRKLMRAFFARIIRDPRVQIEIFKAIYISIDGGNKIIAYGNAAFFAHQSKAMGMMPGTIMREEIGGKSGTGIYISFNENYLAESTP